MKKWGGRGQVVPGHVGHDADFILFSNVSEIKTDFAK